MTIKIGINGLGRIGRMVIRSLAESKNKNIEIKHINNRSNSEISCSLLKYDSVHGKDNKVYALNSEILSISGNVIPLISPKDGSHQTIREDDKSLWENMPSIAYRGKNCFYENDNSPRGTYYRKVYKSGRIKRIFAQEHSAILSREKREEVESLFKDGGTPDAPNLITCTPTMEMGIDVGDLSATMVCSIPPSTTNYLQRIGRAGRSTGNALVLALANAKPHDHLL